MDSELTITVNLFSSSLSIVFQFPHTSSGTKGTQKVLTQFCYQAPVPIFLEVDFLVIFWYSFLRTNILILGLVLMVHTAQITQHFHLPFLPVRSLLYNIVDLADFKFHYIPPRFSVPPEFLRNTF